MTVVADVLKKGVVYFPNNDEKLTDIDVSLEGEVYPLTTKHNRKSIFSTSPAKGLLEITPNEITILDSKGQVFNRFSVTDIVALHVSVVRKMGISAGLIHEPMDYYFTYLEVETKQDHYYFMNNAVMLALNVVKSTAQYQIIDELNLLEN